MNELHAADLRLGQRTAAVGEDHTSDGNVALFNNSFL